MILNQKRCEAGNADVSRDGQAVVTGTRPGSGRSDHLALATDLAAKDFPDQVAGLPNLRQGQRTIDIPAVAAGAHHSGGFQDGQVLGEIGLGDSQSLLQDGKALFSLAQQIEHLEAFWVGEGTANRRLPFEDLRLDAGS